ncbi:MAG: phosphatidate cytidylyltransferase [Methylococcaceae bacterium]|nr:phosphatidate cytidylyltransferase [Methylococcaceae bacterium]MCI0667468.1 phosphatidate cytidylyltransferase [Methylococcaceae bacterium]MCI0732299.1 phosphatidate cytidylyltransferase [Methylococcaceae bacterium]
MLLTRVLTASILAPLIIWAVIGLSQDWFSIVWALVVALCAWEWSKLSGLQSMLSQILFVFAVVAGLLPFWYWTEIIANIANFYENSEILNYSLVVDWFGTPAVVFWLVASVVLKNNERNLLKSRPSATVKLAAGWFMLVTAWVFFVRLRIYHGYEFVLFLLLLIWAADVLAYFIGRAYGKTKLSPLISPGKTMAGMYGALTAGLIMAIVLVFYNDFRPTIKIDFILLSLITVHISIYGDLAISLAKRWRGVKDSGNLLPGHGGLLDRLDSLIAAIPVFYTGIMLIHIGLIQ